MSISPDPGASLPREEQKREQQRHSIPPPPPPPPPPPGYGYAAPYAAPPPPPPQYPQQPPQQAAPPPQYSYGPPPPAPQPYGYAPPVESGGNNAKWFPPAVIVALVLLAGAQIFVAHDANVSRQALQVQLVEMKEKTDALRNQLDGVNEKSSRIKQELDTNVSSLGRKIGSTEHQIGETRKDVEKSAEQLKEEQKQAAAALGQQISTVQQESATRAAAITGEVGGVKKDVDATKKDLDATKTLLKSTMGDLNVQSGLVARNHDELVELRRRGERNYVEFNLQKAKTATKVGEISLRLTKADPKKGRYTIEVNADDKVIEKKDKTVNEPLQFYLARARGIPYEIVVNQVDKDRIVGYLATPK
jgi:hypothetical protein